MKTQENEPPVPHRPLYVIHPANPAPSGRRLSEAPRIWNLRFRGQDAQFQHEQGAFYVAWLLLNPPSEPIHGLGVEMKAKAFFQDSPGDQCETYIRDPETGSTQVIGRDAGMVERNICEDRGNELGYMRRKVGELEAILEDENAIEPVKVEVARELEAIYAFQKRNPLQITDRAQKAVRTVRMAILRLHRNLATAYTPDGKPDPILRQFAYHLLKHLLIPSARYSQFGRARTKTGVAGCFTYEAPADVIWRS